MTREYRTLLIRIEDAIEEAQTARKVALYVAVYAAAVLVFVPYLWMITTSLMPNNLILDDNIYWIPPEVTLQWYRDVLFSDARLIQWFINSIVVATATTAFAMIVNSMAAFALARLEWPVRRWVLGFVLISFMVPPFLTIVPLFLLFVEVNMVNNLWAVILPAVGGPFGVFLLYQFFKDIPDDVQEAAIMDGFSYFQIYWRIILPLSKNVLTALALFIFITNWNAYLWPLVILQRESVYTLPIGLPVLQANYTLQPGLVMASSLLAALPPFVLFLVMQDKLISAVEYQGLGTG